MIVAAVNCIGEELEHLVSDVKIIIAVRADVLIRLLLGDVPAIDYAALEALGVKEMWRLEDCTDAPIEVILWSNYMDAKTTFYEINGVPLAPAKTSGGQRILGKNFTRLPPLSIEKQVENAMNLNAVLEERHPQARKAMVLYDTSRLEGEYKVEFEKATAKIADTMRAFGWPIIPIGSDAPPIIEGDRHWSHYDRAWLREFWFTQLKGMGLECDLLSDLGRKRMEAG